MSKKALVVCKLGGLSLTVYALISLCRATNPDDLQKIKLKGCYFHERSRTKLTCSGQYYPVSITRLWDILGFLSCHYNIEGFYLHHGNLTNLSTNIFIHMSDLKELWVKTSGISILDKTSFNGLKKLETLNLIGNEIQSVPTNINDTLPVLRYLYLDNNEIAGLYKDTFKGFPKNLETLSLGYNKISVIENGALNPLRKLKQLQLRGNQVKHITERTFKFQGNLVILDLSFNKNILLDPGCFSSLTDMRILNLRSCWPDGIPKNQQLFLAQRLEWSMIEKFDLGHNKIDSLTNYGFRPFGSKVKYLDLEACSLEKLEDNVFAQFVNVEVLYLRDNNIKKIDNNAFIGLFSLKQINLQRNDLVTVSENVFKTINKNVKVSLEGNPWSCSCMMSTLRTWLIDNDPKLNVVCQSPSELKGRNIKDVDKRSLQCTKPQLVQCCQKPIVTTIGATVLIECAGTGNPLPIIECFPRLGDPLPKNKSFVSENFGETLSVSRIWVKDVRARNSGIFECHATSSQGQASKKCSMTVTEQTMPIKQSGSANIAMLTKLSIVIMFGAIYLNL